MYSLFCSRENDRERSQVVKDGRAGEVEIEGFHVHSAPTGGDGGRDGSGVVHPLSWWLGL